MFKKVLCSFGILTSGTLAYGAMREHKEIIVFDIDNTICHTKSQKRLKNLNMTPHKKPNFSIDVRRYS